MTELHILIFFSFLATALIHALSDKKTKLVLRISLACVIYFLGLVFLFDFYTIDLKTWPLQEHLPLSIDRYDWLNYLVITLLSIYLYVKSFFDDKEKQGVEIATDMLLLSSLIMQLTDSFFVFSLFLEFIILLITPLMIKAINKKNDYRWYQIIFLPSIILLGSGAVFFSIDLDIQRLLQFPGKPLLFADKSQGPYTDLVLVLALVLVYFSLRFILFYILLFTSLRVRKNLIILLPLLTTLLLSGFVKYFKPVFNESIFSSNMVIFISSLLLLLLVTPNRKLDEPQGIVLLKKSFQILMLLFLSTLMFQVSLKASFFLAAYLLIFIMFFLVFLYLEKSTLSILNEIVDKGRKSFLISAFLFLVTLTLSAFPLSPVAFAMYENFKEIFFQNKSAAIIFGLTYCGLSFSLFYYLKYQKKILNYDNLLKENITSVFFFVSYIGLIFFIKQGEG